MPTAYDGQPAMWVAPNGQMLMYNGGQVRQRARAHVLQSTRMCVTRATDVLHAGRGGWYSWSRPQGASIRQRLSCERSSRRWICRFAQQLLAPACVEARSQAFCPPNITPVACRALCRRLKLAEGQGVAVALRPTNRKANNLLLCDIALVLADVAAR